MLSLGNNTLRSACALVTEFINFKYMNETQESNSMLNPDSAAIKCV